MNDINTLRMLDKAVDAIGVFPRSLNGKDRTEWQEGWNACQSRILEYWHLMEEWGKQVGKEYLDVLLPQDELQLWFREEEVKAFVVLNDVFGYCCADAEEVALDEIPELASLWKKYGFTGAIYWASKKRKEPPIKPITKSQEWRTICNERN